MKNIFSNVKDYELVGPFEYSCLSYCYVLHFFLNSFHVRFFLNLESLITQQCTGGAHSRLLELVITCKVLSIMKYTNMIYLTEQDIILTLGL